MDYAKKKFNIDNIIDAPMPCQIYELWKSTNPQLKIKDQVMKTGEHYSDQYLLRKNRNGANACFTEAEKYGHHMVVDHKQAMVAYTIPDGEPPRMVLKIIRLKGQDTRPPTTTQWYGED